MANLVSIVIFAKKMKTLDGKRTWMKYTTKYEFRTKDENGKVSEERTPIIVNVKFTKEAFDGSSVKLGDLKSRGVLLVEPKFVGIPDIYEVKEDEDGTKKYPECWIRGGISGYTPIVSEHVFHFAENESNEFDSDDEVEEN